MDGIALRTLADAMSAIEAPSRPRAVIIGNPPLLADTHETIVATGVQVASEIDWTTIVRDGFAATPDTVIVVEARGEGEERLETALPCIAAATEAIDVPVVISFSGDTIDVVAAHFLDRRAYLLCEPSAVERTVAVALAAQALGGPMLHDPRAQEGEAVRLRRLNEEVARIADVLSKLTRRDASESVSAEEVSDRHLPFKLQPRDEISVEPADIRRIIRGRRLRDQYFGSGLFEDPAWDMMLDLFAAELERSRVSVSSLCIAAAVAPTTALRWISKLTDAGLFERQPDPFDRRRAYMELSERASSAMREYVGAMRRAGLPLV